MSFDLDALTAAVAAHGRVARVVVAEVHGSTPREVGAAMLVWEDNAGLQQSGTIGGGALEHEAALGALDHEGLQRIPLGPARGQCCGGAVVLLTEHYDAPRLAVLRDCAVIARGPGDAPLAVQRLLDRARGRGLPPEPQLVQGWMVEPLRQPTRDLWIWGAGHVGRALVDVLAPLPDFHVTWVDTGPERFPAEVPHNVTVLPASEPARLMAHAPRNAEHLILTYSHELDLALCHAALQHGFDFCGLIGSDTKKARFAKRLQALGHETAQIDSICCPIGQKSLGKAPQAIAIGVTAQLLTRQRREGHGWTTFSSASTA